MENFTKDLAKHMMLDNLKYGPLVNRERRLELLKKQDQLLKETREAEADLDKMIKDAGL